MQLCTNDTHFSSRLTHSPRSSRRSFPRGFRNLVSGHHADVAFLSTSSSSSSSSFFFFCPDLSVQRVVDQRRRIDRRSEDYSRGERSMNYAGNWIRFIEFDLLLTCCSRRPYKRNGCPCFKSIGANISRMARAISTKQRGKKISLKIRGQLTKLVAFYRWDVSFHDWWRYVENIDPFLEMQTFVKRADPMEENRAGCSWIEERVRSRWMLDLSRKGSGDKNGEDSRARGTGSPSDLVEKKEES